MTALAYAVTEKDENTGGIFFAEHRIAAAIRGANEYADGDLSQVACRRAPWADQFAETGRVPASIMVAAGWHFECHGCGVRIDGDLPERWQDEVRKDDALADKLRRARRHRQWNPSDVIGFGEGPGAVFCDAGCQNDHRAAQERRERVEAIIRAKYRKIVERCFPGAQIEGKGHVYVVEQQGVAAVREGEAGRPVWRIEQVIIRFDYPGRKYGMAELRFERSAENRHRRGGRAISVSCSSGDLDAFNEWRNNSLKKAA